MNPHVGQSRNPGHGGEPVGQLVDLAAEVGRAPTVVDDLDQRRLIGQPDPEGKRVGVADGPFPQAGREGVDRLVEFGDRRCGPQPSPLLVDLGRLQIGFGGRQVGSEGLQRLLEVGPTAAFALPERADDHQRREQHEQAVAEVGLPAEQDR